MEFWNISFKVWSYKRPSTSRGFWSNDQPCTDERWAYALILDQGGIPVVDMSTTKNEFDSAESAERAARAAQFQRVHHGKLNCALRGRW